MRCSLGIIAIDLMAGNLEGVGALRERELRRKNWRAGRL